MTFDEAMLRAAKIGAEHGRAAASWIFDGNTDRHTYEVFRRGIEECDSEILDRLPAPDLSGEWADGYTPGELITECGLSYVDLDDDEEEDLIDAYRQAFTDAATHAVTETIDRQLSE